MPLSVEGSDPGKSVRPWLYFIVVTAALSFICCLLYGLKQDVQKTTFQIRESNEMVKEKLPPILDNSKKATDALVRMTDDVNTLRNLISPSEPGKEGDNAAVFLAKYAGTVLDRIEKHDVIISSKLVSKPAKQWVADERKECLVLAFRVNSKKEMVEKICCTVFGNPWQVTTKSGEKMVMLDWVRKNNPEIDVLFENAK